MLFVSEILIKLESVKFLNDKIKANKITKNTRNISNISGRCRLMSLRHKIRL